ncbi:MAG: branched-chain amino acid ABC transporter permease [Bacillota bacterium]
MLIAGQYIIDSIVLGSIYALMAIGFSIIFSLVNIVNLAHGEMYVIGAFTSFYLMTEAGLPYPAAVMVSMVVMALLAAALYWGVFQRLGGDRILNSMLVSIGLSIFIQNAIKLTLGPEYRKIPFQAKAYIVGPFILTNQRIILIVVSAGFVIGLSIWLKRTWFGQAVRATAQDEETAAVMGIRVTTVKRLIFILGAVMATLAGGLLGGMFPIGPSSGFAPGLKAFTITIFGAVGSIPGALMGSFVLALGETLASGYLWSALSDVVSFILLIIVLITRPDGLFGRNRS